MFHVVNLYFVVCLSYVLLLRSVHASMQGHFDQANFNSTVNLQQNCHTNYLEPLPKSTNLTNC